MDELILLKPYIVDVYKLRMYMHEDNPGSTQYQGR